MLVVPLTRGHDVSHTPTTALVLLGGEPVDVVDHGTLPTAAFVVAADSGIDQAHLLGRHVDLAVGDFDSVSAGGLARARAEGAEVREHPVEKAATDFELALDAVAARGITSVVVAGGEGGRLDHLISNALVMSSERFAGLEITAVGRGGSRLHVVRGSRLLAGEPGEYVTLVAVHGAATGVTTEGLRYPLVEARLEPGSSLGVSNELLVPRARVDVAVGVLLAILPGPESP
ncbi:MAG: thiamine diphosphokinase [Acidimicrobiia bacterium]|nr:thiamine diphosphokinase [Acidimicrobiia bacterium]